MKIIDKIRGYRRPFVSMEFFPPAEQSQLGDFFTTVEKLRTADPLFASVTYGAGGGKQDRTLDIVTRLARMDLTVMSHLTCVNARVLGLAEYLGQLQDAGVNNVLALRGDPPKGTPFEWTGPFQYAVDLVRYIRLQAEDMGIAVAGYPSPHPQSRSYAEDRAFTLAKIRAGADFVISQVFFDVRQYFELADWLRAKGCDVPVIPGILPIQSFKSLRHVLSMCGASIPGKLFLELEEADRTGGTAEVYKRGVDFAVDMISRLLIGGTPGIHLYTLNKADMCLSIVKECGFIR